MIRFSLLVALYQLPFRPLWRTGQLGSINTNCNIFLDSVSKSPSLLLFRYLYAPLHMSSATLPFFKMLSFRIPNFVLAFIQRISIRYFVYCLAWSNHCHITGLRTNDRTAQDPFFVTEETHVRLLPRAVQNILYLVTPRQNVYSFLYNDILLCSSFPTVTKDFFLLGTIGHTHASELFVYHIQYHYRLRVLWRIVLCFSTLCLVDGTRQKPHFCCLKWESLLIIVRN